jgi:hypothetical protein
MKLRKTVVLADLSKSRIGETDDLGRPLASGIHVSPARQMLLGAIGIAPQHRSDGRGLTPRPSNPHEEGTLREPHSD